MELSSNDNWKPGQRVLFWARASCYSLCAGAWLGAALFFVAEQLAIAVLVLSLPIAFLGFFRFWLEIGHDEGIPLNIRTKLKQNLVFSGPIAPLQVLIYNRFPDSGFSGLNISNRMGKGHS